MDMRFPTPERTPEHFYSIPYKYFVKPMWSQIQPNTHVDLAFGQAKKWDIKCYKNTEKSQAGRLRDGACVIQLLPK